VRTDPADADLVIGTVDLVSAAGMFGSGVLKRINDMTVSAPVAAEFTVTNGKIAELRVSGEDLAAALEREAIVREWSNDLREVVSSMDVAVEFDQVAEVDVRPPDPSLHMSGEQMESREGCAAAR
jgi:hypothetical protein